MARTALGKSRKTGQKLRKHVNMESDPFSHNRVKFVNMDPGIKSMAVYQHNTLGFF